ncbi:MAG: hypothetical protein KKD39_04830 [Candidatus Altiarchaeota archaeon]|nr:hypothetical protein [Candidatus Altiarchaeota archaeon]
MVFKVEKSQAVNNLRVSDSVGDVDRELMPLLEKINNLPDFYTTSSCGGRVVLMQDLGSKKLDNFVGKWHRKVSMEDVFPLFKPCDGLLWFRYESPILHVMARSLDKASWFLHLCRESGFKRSGIQSVKDERILIEVLSTERIDVPIMSEGRKLVSEEYINFLIEQANIKYDLGTHKLDRLEKNLG